MQPDFIAADEAVSALDVSIQAQIINLLADLQREFELTYLFIAHDLSVVRHISDRIAVMYLGEVVELSPSRELYDKPLHPYTCALVSAVPIPDPKVEKTRKRMILRGDVPSPANPPSGCRFHTRCWLRRELGDPERCAEETPELRVMQPGHRVACHYAEELAGERRSTLLTAAAEHSDARDVSEEELVAADVATARRSPRTCAGTSSSTDRLGCATWSTASRWPRSRRGSATSTRTSRSPRTGCGRRPPRARSSPSSPSWR